MKSSKSYLPRKLLAMALSFALAVTWLVPSSLAVYAEGEESEPQEVSLYGDEAATETADASSDSVTEETAVEETDAEEAAESSDSNEESDADAVAGENEEPAEEENEEPAEFAYNSGSGTAEDPGVISDAATLAAFAEEIDAGNHVSDYVKLGADIDLSGIENWNPIGAEGKASANKTKLFAGTFDGNGKTVSGMKISGTYEEEANAGLFSTLGGNAQIFDIVLTGVDINVTETGSWTNARAGGVAGDTQSANPAAAVSGCTVSGKIHVSAADGQGFAGGILGRAFTNSAVINCASYADAEAVTNGSWNAAYAGSLVGMTGSNTVLANCAALGNAKASNESSDGDAYAGGIAGMLSSKTYNVYACSNSSITQVEGAKKNYVGVVAGQAAGSSSGSYVYYAETEGIAPYGESLGTISEDSFVKVAAADMTEAAFADTLNGNLKNTYKTLGGSYSLKQWTFADGKAVPAGEDYTYVEEMASTSIGGVTYFYADTEGALENAVYQAVVKSKKGTATYKFSKAELTQVGETSYYYAVATGTTPLSGTLYGYGEGKATTYKSVYADLGVETDDSYDAITSATKFTGHHAKDIPSLVTYGTKEDGEKYINGLTLERSAVQVEATPYVEASILKAAGETLTSDQESLLGVTLKVNPMNAPSTETVPVKVKSAEWTSSKYGLGEFAIVPDDTVEGYVWSEYWGSVYAATVSDGTTTAGAVHWIDLYGEAATSGGHYNKLQLALNNGTSTASNKAEVNRYAAFFDSNNNLKTGTYTIKIYAEGYDTLTAEVNVTSEYVLMNIPYDKFYEAEGVSGVDTVTSATAKTYNTGMAAGSYHKGSLNATDPDTDDPLDKAEILGVTYPVLVKDLSELEGLTEVTDDSTATITVVSGKAPRTTQQVRGKDVLFASGDYAYYVMDTVPAVFKTLSVEGENKTFSKVSAEAEKAEFTSAAVSYGGHYTDIELKVEDAEHINGKVNAIVLTAGDEKYALRHVEDIWRMTDLGWNKTGLDGNGLQGKTITNVTYYVTSGEGVYGIYSYDTNAYVKPFSDAEVSAAFDNSSSITVTGLPEDAQNPIAKVATSGRNAVVIAENVPVKDGKISISGEPVGGTKYNVVIATDNYADFSASAEYSNDMAAADAAAVANTAKSAAAKINATDYTAASYKVVTDAIKALNEAVASNDAAAIKAATAALNTAVSSAKAKSNTTIKVSPLKKNYKVKTLKKKAKKFQLKAVVSSGAKATFTKVSGNKKITVSKTGKVTVKKKLKKGTYKVKVKVTAPATANAKAASTTVTVVVKVKK